MSGRDQFVHCVASRQRDRGNIELWNTGEA